MWLALNMLQRLPSKKVFEEQAIAQLNKPERAIWFQQCRLYAEVQVSDEHLGEAIRDDHEGHDHAEHDPWRPQRPWPRGTIMTTWKARPCRTRSWRPQGHDHAEHDHDDHKGHDHAEHDHDDHKVMTMLNTIMMTMKAMITQKVSTVSSQSLSTITNVQTLRSWIPLTPNGSLNSATPSLWLWTW